MCRKRELYESYGLSSLRERACAEAVAVTPARASSLQRRTRTAGARWVARRVLLVSQSCASCSVASKASRRARERASEMRRLVASRDQVWRGSGRASVKCSRPLPRSSSSPSTQRIAQPCSRRCLDLAPRPRPPLRRPHRAHLASLNGPSSAQPGPRRPPQQPAGVRPARPLERSSFASAWIAARKEDGAGSVRLPPTIEAASRPSASSANSPSSAHLPGAAQRTHRAVCDGAPPPLTLLARYIRPDPPCRPTPTSPGSLATSSSLSRSPSSSSVLPAPSPAARRAQTEEQQLPPRPQPRRQPCSTKRPVRRLFPLPRQSARHALTPGVRAGNEVVRQDFNMALGFAAALVLLVCAPAAASWFANRRYTSGWILRRGTSRASASHFSRTDEKGEKGEKGEKADKFSTIEVVERPLPLKITPTPAVFASCVYLSHARRTSDRGAMVPRRLLTLSLLAQDPDRLQPHPPRHVALVRAHVGPSRRQHPLRAPLRLLPLLPLPRPPHQLAPLGRRRTRSTARRLHPRDQEQRPVAPR